MSNDVIYLSSGQSGAPAIGGTAGSLISWLVTVLTTGYGFVQLESVVVSDGVATATRSAGHGFTNITSKSAIVLGPVVAISGATPAGLNGNKRITVLSTTTFTFEAPGVSDGVATGTIIANMPPLGWELVWNTGTKAVFRNTAGTGMYLRFTDDGTFDSGKVARVTGFESMTDVDTGAGQFPPPASGQRYIPKYDSSTAMAWRVIGDAKRFWIFNAYYSNRGYWPGFFGDLISFVPGDAYHFILAGDTAPTSGTAPDSYSSPWYKTFSSSTDQYALWAPRGWNAVPGAFSYTMGCATLAGHAWGGYESAMPTLINPPDGRAWWTYPLYAVRGADPRHIRGIFPGAWRPDMYITSDTIDIRDQMLFASIENGGGAMPLVFPICVSFGSTASMYGGVDVLGPWE